MRLAAFALLALLSACNRPQPTSPAGPPASATLPEEPSPPKFPGEVAYRPGFHLGGETQAAGTAFVVRDAKRKDYLVTAVHVMDPPEWRQTRSAELQTLAGQKVADTDGEPTYQGRPFDAVPELPGGFPDMREDLVVWPLRDKGTVNALKLAKGEPASSSSVWVLGRQVGGTGPMQMFRCRVMMVRDGGFIGTMEERFNPHAFSGGPVVNARGEVVGNLLGSDPQRGTIMGATVESIRKRLAEKGIQAE